MKSTVHACLKPAIAAAVAALATLLPCSPAVAQETRRPNIVMIVADDLGNGELGCYGGRDIPTPNIDSIARNGVRFTSGYVSAPVCAPSRASLLTGRYQQRFGFEFNNDASYPLPPNYGLPDNQSILPQHLRPAGYASGIFGKWHLGQRESQHPLSRGFDSFYGFLGGAHYYLPIPAPQSSGIFRNRQEVRETEYLTDALGRETADFIRQRRAQTFFAYLAFNAVHMPLQGPDRHKQRFALLRDPKRIEFAGMLLAMDEAVGRVLDTLKESNLQDNTLIIFISDNGARTAQTTCRNAPFRGGKGQLLEGGIRLPFLMQWKGQIPAGKVYDAPVISLDILPTILAAAGIRPPADTPLDGVNLLPFLKDPSSAPPHNALFWRFGEQYAVRQGDWKLLVQDGKTPAVYNLAQDIGETTDLGQSNPPKLAELQVAYDQWNASNIRPLWPLRSGPATRRTPAEAIPE